MMLSTKKMSAKFAPLSQQEDELFPQDKDVILEGLDHPDESLRSEGSEVARIHHRPPTKRIDQPLEIDNGSDDRSVILHEDNLDPHAGELGGDLKSSTVNIIKGMVGPAILYLPHGFAHAGYIVAIPVLFTSAALFLASSSCLLQAWKVMDNHKGPDEPPLSYPLLARQAFGPMGETIVKLGIAAMQSGVCLTYLIFVPQNLHQSVLELFQVNLPEWVFLIAMLMIQIPLSWITNIRKLTVTNALANSLILYGLVTCLLFALDQVIRPSNETRATTDNATVDSSFIETPMNNIVEKWQRLEAFNKDGWFLFIGTSVLLFEGSITLLIPLQEAVQTQHDRQAFAELYPKVILSIITFYTFFGLTCWLAFGNDVNTVMTTSLLENGIDNDEDRSNVHISGLRILAAASVQLAYSLAVLLTFPLQNFPSLEITTAAIGNISGCHRNAVSSTIILLLGVVAVMTMDSLDKVVSLMGALLGCPLAFCVPPLIHNRLVVGNNDNNSFENTTHKSPSNHCWQLFKNKLIVVLGLLAMILASVATLVKWNNGD